MTLYVVRHGETNENINKLMIGHQDTLLNEKGISQALEVKEKLKGISFDAVYASPLQRAYKTASIITDQEIVQDDRLKSRNHGEFQGVRRDSIDLEKYWNLNVDDYKEAESVKEVLSRVASFLEDLKKNHDSDDKILITTHSGVCRVLYYYFNGIPENGDMLSDYEAVNGRIEIYEM
jgi:broad specificity phosphatase PhoE